MTCLLLAGLVWVFFIREITLRESNELWKNRQDIGFQCATNFPSPKPSSVGEFNRGQTIQLSLDRDWLHLLQRENNKDFLGGC